tara:strand:- start:328 stop:993 length:666 start_codon:yes stop_codon:yes gene_type:complete
MRRFAIVGHRAMSQGKLPLNDMAGGAGRMDVLVRALMAGLLTSHGIRHDTEVVLHLMGGPGPSRRIKFVGSQLKGVHAEERAVAGQIAKVLKLPTPARGHWIERSSGIFDSGGDINHTLSEWKDVVQVCLDASAPRLWNADESIPTQSNALSTFEGEHGNFTISGIDIGFILSDDKPLPNEIQNENTLIRSLGDAWLQGHMAIAVCHFLLDQGISLNLSQS